MLSSQNSVRRFFGDYSKLFRGTLSPSRGSFPMKLKDKWRVPSPELKLEEFYPTVSIQTRLLWFA